MTEHQPVASPPLRLRKAQRRQQEILRTLCTDRETRVWDLSRTLDVHYITILRDLNILAAQGLVLRTPGGAQLREQVVQDLPFDRRLQLFATEKAAMARLAASLVQDGDRLLLDASTSALALAELLSRRRVHLTTTGLETVRAFSERGSPAFLSGGLYHPASRSLVGQLGLHPAPADTVFFSAAGFTLGHGFTEVHRPEAAAKRSLIGHARRLVALMDHSKFGRVAPHQVAPTSEVHLIVTDSEPTVMIREALTAAGIRLLVTPAAAPENEPTSAAATTLIPQA